MPLYCFEDGGSMSRGCHRDVRTSKEVRWFHGHQKEVAVVAKLINNLGEQRRFLSAALGSTRPRTDLFYLVGTNEEEFAGFRAPTSGKETFIPVLSHKAVSIKLTDWGIRGEFSWGEKPHAACCQVNSCAWGRGQYLSGIGHPLAAIPWRMETWRHPLDLGTRDSQWPLEDAPGLGLMISHFPAVRAPPHACRSAAPNGFTGFLDISTVSVLEQIISVVRGLSWASVTCVAAYLASNHEILVDPGSSPTTRDKKFPQTLQNVAWGVKSPSPDNQKWIECRV